MKKEVNTEKESDDRYHYESLLSFFKNLVWLTSTAIVLITIVALFFTYNNISEMKKELTDLAFSSTKTIEKTELETKKQLEFIKEEAQLTAIRESKLRIEKEFASKNIKNLIDITAKQEIRQKLEKIVELETKKISNYLNKKINEQYLVNDAIIQMRVGRKSGFMTLKKMAESDNLDINEIAREQIDIISKDYEEHWIENKNYYLGGGEKFEDAVRNYMIVKSKDDKKSIEEAIEFILTSNELTLITLSTMFLREKTGIQFKMFDFDSIAKYKKDRK